MELTLIQPEEFTKKLDLILQEIADLKKAQAAAEPSRIPFNQFCREHGISRVTGYAWRDRGLIRLEKIGSRQFVIRESIVVQQRYQREPAAA